MDNNVIFADGTLGKKLINEGYSLIYELPEDQQLEHWTSKYEMHKEEILKRIPGMGEKSENEGVVYLKRFCEQFLRKRADVVGEDTVNLIKKWIVVEG